MSREIGDVVDIARASLLPDFFRARIEEEGLYGTVQQMVAQITFPKPIPKLDAIKQIA